MAEADTPLLRNRDFLLFVATRTGNVFGLQALDNCRALVCLSADRQSDGYWLYRPGTVRPALLLFLVAGIAADRIDRRIILSTSNAVHAIVTAALMALAGRRCGQHERYSGAAGGPRRGARVLSHGIPGDLACTCSSSAVSECHCVVRVFQQSSAIGRTSDCWGPDRLCGRRRLLGDPGGVRHVRHNRT